MRSTALLLSSLAVVVALTSCSLFQSTPKDALVARVEVSNPGEEPDPLAVEVMAIDGQGDLYEAIKRMKAEQWDRALAALRSAKGSEPSRKEAVTDAEKFWTRFALGVVLEKTMDVQGALEAYNDALNIATPTVGDVDAAAEAVRRCNRKVGDAGQ